MENGRCHSSPSQLRSHSYLYLYLSDLCTYYTTIKQAAVGGEGGGTQAVH